MRRVTTLTIHKTKPATGGDDNGLRELIQNLRALAMSASTGEEPSKQPPNNNSAVQNIGAE